MISAGSKIPSIGHWRGYPGTAKTSFWRRSAVRWAVISSTLVVLPCLLVQGWSSGTKAVAKGDPGIPQSTKGDLLLTRIVRSAPITQRPAGVSFADRYSAAGTLAHRSTPHTAGDRTGTVPPGSYRLASLSPELPYAPPGIRQPQTKLIGFDNSAFPYSGRQGARYSDNRVLVHVPAGFDVRKPGVIVVFFHGHGATLERDVRDRQLLPSQISESGVNAVLVAPQLAYDAADSSAGKFWEPGGLKRFMAEAADRLAGLYGDPRTSEAFASMPVVIVAYSGGFETAAWSLQIGGLGKRVTGVVLLDALYGHLEKYSSWIVKNRQAFFVSSYTQGTKRRDDELAQMLRTQGIRVQTELDGPLNPGTVAFLSTREGIGHRDYVTLAWTDHPVKDILLRVAQR